MSQNAYTWVYVLYFNVPFPLLRMVWRAASVVGLSWSRLSRAATPQGFRRESVSLAPGGGVGGSPASGKADSGEPTRGHRDPLLTYT